MGVAALDRCARELGVRAELTAMLEHMILSHHDLPEYGSPRRPMFPEAEVLHILDVPVSYTHLLTSCPLSSWRLTSAL